MKSIGNLYRNVLASAIFTLLSCHCLAIVVTPNDSSRIFVGGLSTTCTDQLLEDRFKKFGTILNVSIMGLNENIYDAETTMGQFQNQKKRIPYAFVTFDSVQSALNAIAEFKDCSGTHSENQLFQQVKSAHPIDTSKRIRSNASRLNEQKQREEILYSCRNTNLLIQVQTTHVDRFEDYIEVVQIENSDLIINVEGTSKSVTKNMSLVLLSVSDPTELARRLMLDSILQRAVKKYYIVNPGALEVDLTQFVGCSMAIDHAMDRACLAENDSFRIQAFPPSVTSTLLSSIEAKNREMLPSEAIKVHPRYFNRLLSVVEVYRYKGRRAECNNFSLVMSGASDSFLPKNDQAEQYVSESDDAINRAYFKLSEAMVRYSNEHLDVKSSMFENAVALDVGSSPGGWTKFLACDMKCKSVYSVDPGNLEIDLWNVHHMQMKIQDAIPILKQNKLKFHIFVSDMCLHEMEQQLDFLLLARDEGILDENAFFVLTLKCNSGFSKENFDGQVQKVVETLVSRVKTEKISTYHLFSNRNGERTIMGFIV